MSDDGPVVEFLDGDEPAPRSAPVAGGSSGPPERAPRRTAAALITLALLAIVAVGVARLGTTPHSHPVASPSPTSSGRTVPTSPAAPVALTPVVRNGNGPFPATQLDLVAAQVCLERAGCRPEPAPASALRAARRAVGRITTVQARRIGPGHAFAVGLSVPEGGQLLAIASRPGVVIDTTALGIPVPYGMQDQDNGRDHVVVVLSGNASAIRLLERPRVQRWLASLHAR